MAYTELRNEQKSNCMKSLVALSEPYRISAVLRSFVENLQRGPSCTRIVRVTPSRNCPLFPRSFSSAEGSVQLRSCAESELTLLPPFCSVVSPIDGKSMESITSVKIFHGSEYKANGKVIRWTEVGPAARLWGRGCGQLLPQSPQEAAMLPHEPVVPFLPAQGAAGWHPAG